MPDPSPWFRGSVVARELDEYAETMGDLWDGEVQQMAAASAATRCRYLTDGHAVLYEESLGATNLQRASLRGDRLAIALPNAIAGAGRWLGMGGADTGLSFIRGGEPFELTLPSGSEIRVAILDWSRFEADFESMAGISADRVFSRSRSLSQVDPEVVARLRGLWGRWLGGAGPSTADLSGLLTESIARAWFAGGDSDLADGEQRADERTYRRIIGRLQGRDLPAGPGQLAGALGISLRTLHNACRHGSGRSAGQLIRVHRLGRVRRDLLRFQHGERTVAELALAHGFSELGRFAGEYRRVFGELPSATLRLRSPRVRLMRVGTVPHGS